MPRAQVTNRINFLYFFACRKKKKSVYPASLMDFKGGPVINGQTISAGVLQRVYYMHYVHTSYV